jgi:hypothetical protein
MAFTNTLPKRFYQHALTKIKPFAEKSTLMLFNLTVDLVVDAAGRDQRAEGLVPDWRSLRDQAKEELKEFSEADLRHLLATTFGLKTQEQILERFGQLRSRKRRASGYGGETFTDATPHDDLDDDFEESLDEEFID